MDTHYSIDTGDYHALIINIGNPWTRIIKGKWLHILAGYMGN